MLCTTQQMSEYQLGEGFGIPIIEAQAAGCPVIVTDCTAMTELCLSGWLIEKGTDFMHFPGAMQRRPERGRDGNAFACVSQSQFF